MVDKRRSTAQVGPQQQRTDSMTEGWQTDAQADAEFALVPPSPLDAVDYAIVRALERDSRITVQKLSQQLGAARLTIAERIARLIETGVVRLHARVNYRRLGYLITAFVGLQTAQTPTEVDIVTALRRVPEVEDIYTVTGEYDVLIKIRARSPEHLQHLLVFKISTIPNVQRTVTMLALGSHQEGAPVGIARQSGGDMSGVSDHADEKTD
jgi:DNA-binding Lrp family transcriptional regulator